MVYHGPSKGCLVCRKRRVRCDLTQPHCTNCLRLNEHCPGIRQNHPVQFQDETQSILRRMQTGDRDQVQMALRIDHSKPLLPVKDPAKHHTSEIMSRPSDDRIEDSKSMKNDKQRILSTLPAALADHGGSSSLGPGRGLSSRTSREASSDIFDVPNKQQGQYSSPSRLFMLPLLSQRRGATVKVSLPDICFVLGHTCSESGQRNSPQRSKHKISVEVPRPPKGGEYDPFGAFAFRVDATVNEVLRFWYSYEGRKAQVSEEVCYQAVGEGAWRFFTLSFLDFCSGYAMLASLTALYSASVDSKAIGESATTFRNFAIARLRQRLAAGDLSVQNLACVQALLTAEIATRDFEAAASHAKFLCQFYQSQTGVSTILLNAMSPHNLEGMAHSFLWLEIHRAVSTCTRPALNLQTWLYCYVPQPEPWIPSTLSYSSCLKEASGLDHDALRDPHLRQLFTEVRFYAQVIFCLHERQDLPRKDCIQLSTRILLLTGRLLQYSIDRVEEVRDLGAENEPSNKLQRLQRIAASLAAIYLLRLVTRDESVGTIKPTFYDKVYATGPAIAQKIASLLKVSAPLAQSFMPPSKQHSILTTQNLSPHVRLRLWILHIGTFIERMAPWHSCSNGYLQQELRKITEDSGLLENPEVGEEILNGFLPINMYTDVPRGIIFPACRHMEWRVAPEAT